jgi:nitrite reductase/ring-hydroxylating ferredoxin subunit
VTPKATAAATREAEPIVRYAAGPVNDDDLGPHPWTTLPGRDYHEPDVFELERHAVFARSWTCVGRSEDLAREGDYVAIDVADEPLILLRGRDGQMRAFANTCRHRGTQLLEGTGNVRAVTCPYHAWTYALDGSLAGTPNVHAEDGVDRDALGLHRVRLAEWGGFVFVNLDGTATAFEDELARDRWLGSNGFVRNMDAPAASTRSRVSSNATAESTTTGTSFVRGFPRSSARTSNPSITGIIRSSTMASGRWRCAAASPRSPSSDNTTS